MSDPYSQVPPAEAEIRALVGVIAEGRPDAEVAWAQLWPLGERVVPYFAAAYARARRWHGRAALSVHAIGYARMSSAAFQLGLAALEDKSYLVRYRAAMVRTYSLNPDAIPALELASTHVDPRTVADARAALDAILQQNHHYFIDRTHSGQTFWELHPGDL